MNPSKEFTKFILYLDVSSILFYLQKLILTNVQMALQRKNKKEANAKY